MLDQMPRQYGGLKRLFGADDRPLGFLSSSWLSTSCIKCHSREFGYIENLNASRLKMCRPRSQIYGSSG